MGCLTLRTEDTLRDQQLRTAGAALAAGRALIARSGERQAVGVLVDELEALETIRRTGRPAPLKYRVEGGKFSDLVEKLEALALIYSEDDERWEGITARLNLAAQAVRRIEGRR